MESMVSCLARSYLSLHVHQQAACSGRIARQNRGNSSVLWVRYAIGGR
jgi:hypothetical protein